MQRAHLACQHSSCGSAPTSVRSPWAAFYLAPLPNVPFIYLSLLKCFHVFLSHRFSIHRLSCFFSHHLTFACKTWVVCFRMTFSSTWTASPGPLSLWVLPPLYSSVDFLLPATSPFYPQGPSALSYFAPYTSLIPSTHFSPSSPQIFQHMPASACFTGSRHLSRCVYSIHELKSAYMLCTFRRMELEHPQVWGSFCFCFHFWFHNIFDF